MGLEDIPNLAAATISEVQAVMALLDGKPGNSNAAFYAKNFVMSPRRLAIEPQLRELAEKLEQDDEIDSKVQAHLNSPEVKFSGNKLRK